MLLWSIQTVDSIFFSFWNCWSLTAFNFLSPHISESGTLCFAFSVSQSHSPNYKETTLRRHYLQFLFIYFNLHPSNILTVLTLSPRYLIVRCSSLAKLWSSSGKYSKEICRCFQACSGILYRVSQTCPIFEWCTWKDSIFNVSDGTWTFLLCITANDFGSGAVLAISDLKHLWLRNFLLSENVNYYNECFGTVSCENQIPLVDYEQ